MEKSANDLASMQKLLEPLFPGLMGAELIEASAERVVASMPVPRYCFRNPN